MFKKSRLILATALTALAVAAPSASALIQPGDLRGEHAAGQSQTPSVTGSVAPDLRSPDAVEPFERPVVVEVGGVEPSSFDWSAGVIGLGAGVALVLLTTAGVMAGRRRHTRPTTV